MNIVTELRYPIIITGVAYENNVWNISNSKYHKSFSVFPSPPMLNAYN